MQQKSLPMRYAALAFFMAYSVIDIWRELYSVRVL